MDIDVEVDVDVFIAPLEEGVGAGLEDDDGFGGRDGGRLSARGNRFFFLILCTFLVGGDTVDGLE